MAPTLISALVLFRSGSVLAFWFWRQKETYNPALNSKKHQGSLELKSSLSTPLPASESSVVVGPGNPGQTLVSYTMILPIVLFLSSWRILCSGTGKSVFHNMAESMKISFKVSCNVYIVIYVEKPCLLLMLSCRSGLQHGLKHENIALEDFLFNVPCNWHVAMVGSLAC